MKVTFDDQKRQNTLAERVLDFLDAPSVFEGPTLTQEDDRFAYPEPRFQTYGLFEGRLVMFAWTPIPEGIHVISMRKCNDREQRKFANRLG
ncbi:MAG: BrnT family toxin [Novosphingobium sp.]|nr:BrnT family toxin [Novosphingobium sp.]